MKNPLQAIFTFALLSVLLLAVSPSQASIATEITIERFVYDGHVSYDYDEYVKICNISTGSIDLGGTNPWRMGDDESDSGGGEGMYELQGTLNTGDCFIVASNANAFNDTWGFLPNYEMRPSVTGWSDNTSVPNLTAVDAGNWQLSNSGDNITLWKYDTDGSSYVQHDEIAYGSSADRYTEVGLPSDSGNQISCSGNAAVTRNSASSDTDDMANDFNCTDNPNTVTFSSISVTSAPIFPWAIGLGLLTAVVVGLTVVVVRRRA